MNQIIAIDPGTLESGWCLYRDQKVALSGIASNEQMLAWIIEGISLGFDPDATLAIEMVASYGMPVGKEVFETVRWIGRFQQAWHRPDDVRLIYRKDIKLHLCGSARAKDGNVRQALIDMIGPQGVKKTPGPTYGVKSHAWNALAVAVTCEHNMRQAG